MLIMYICPESSPIKKVDQNYDKMCNEMILELG